MPIFNGSFKLNASLILQSYNFNFGNVLSETSSLLIEGL